MDFTQFFKYYMGLILWIIRNFLLTRIWKSIKQSHANDLYLTDCRFRDVSVKGSCKVLAESDR